MIKEEERRKGVAAKIVSGNPGVCGKLLQAVGIGRDMRWYERKVAEEDDKVNSCLVVTREEGS